VIYVQVFVVSVIGGEVCWKVYGLYTEILPSIRVVLATAFLFSIVVMASASDYMKTHHQV
jgi:hypothetical protein